MISSSKIRICSDERGTATVEYAVLLTLVSLGLAFALAAIGVPLVKMYVEQRAWLSLPMP